MKHKSILEYTLKVKLTNKKIKTKSCSAW